MVQKFLDALRNDPRAQELIKDMPVPKSDEEAVACYAKLAKDLGFDLTIDDIKAGLKAMENDRKAQSDKVSLDADDLENVAGGANEGCNDTHHDGEWCWFTDSCSYIITYYAPKDEVWEDEDFKKPEEETIVVECKNNAFDFG